MLKASLKLTIMGSKKTTSVCIQIPPTFWLRFVSKIFGNFFQWLQEKAILFFLEYSEILALTRQNSINIYVILIIDGEFGKHVFGNRYLISFILLIVNCANASIVNNRYMYIVFEHEQYSIIISEISFSDYQNKQNDIFFSQLTN